MTLHMLAAHWLVHSLGWTLLHFCWQGAIVALVLWCALQLLASHRAQTRYLAACAALSLMVVLPLATFVYIALNEHRLASTAHLATVPGLVVQAGFGEAAAPWLLRLATALDPAIPWLLLAYLVGSLFFIFRLSVGFGVARRMKLIAISPAAADLLTTFATLKHRFQIHRAVSLMNSALVQVPTVIGWLRPVVLLPVNCFTGMSTAQIEAILCHELAHIRRHDYLVSIFQSVVEAVLFYHPAIWWVSTQIRRERECCCDDLALSLGGDALAYARALSALEVQRSSYPQVALGVNGGVLTMRIKRLLGLKDVSAASQTAAVVVLAMLVVSAVAIATTARAESLASANPVQVPTPVAPVALVAQVAVPAASPAVKRIAPNPPLLAFAAKPPIPAIASITANPVATNEASANELQEAQPIKVAAGVIAGKILSKVQPLYPDDARAAHISGAVVLHAIISKTGDVKSLAVISGPKELQMSALDAVSQWKYEPFLVNDEPTEVDTTITVNYHFGGGPSDETAQNTATPRTIGNGVKPPTVIFSPEPVYTEVARAKKISGNVLIRLWVDEQGNPTHVKVAQGLGYGLDEKAVEVVRRYRFKPASENGTPVLVAMNVEINFQLY